MILNRFDIAPGHLRATIERLADIGVTDAMPEAAEILEQAEKMRRVDLADMRAEYEDLPRKVADGEVSLAAAVARQAELTQWVATSDAFSPARRLAERAAEHLEKLAIFTAQREAVDAMSALVPLAAAAVDEAAQAGREIIGGVDAAELLSRFKREYVIDSGELPESMVFDRATIDRSKRLAFDRAEDATLRFRAVRQLAAELQHLDVPAWRAVSVPTHAQPLQPSERGMIERLPEPLQLACMVNSGMKPGLVLDGVPGVAPYEPPNDEKSVPFGKVKAWLGGKR